ncbi:MAG: ribosome-associated translation inhibitor RaiA [Chitinophagales bacterium]
MKVEIQAVHFNADEKLKSFIEAKAEKLNTFFDRIIDCSVTLSLEHNGASIKDKNVVVKVQIPGALLVAKESTKLFEESTDLAFDHIRRQIRKHKSKLRQHV